MKKREKRWKEEKAEINGKIASLEKRINQGEKKVEEMKIMEQRMKKLKVDGKADGRGNMEGGWYMLEKLERRIEMREREDRRKNIIIKGMNIGGKIRREMEELFVTIGAKVEIESVRKIEKRKKRE